MDTVEGRDTAKTTGNKAEYVNTIIIGASAAGLACAAALKKKKLPFVILEKTSEVAAPWRSHYERLHLNTEKWSSHLPFHPFPKDAEIYLSRNELVAYMEDYATRFGIQPIFNQQVQSIARADNGWRVKALTREWVADNVIIATGNNRHPVIPSWPGTHEFKGPIIHSAAYKNGSAFKGKHVLVVGFGSSACEIAICLHESGAYPSMSVKGGVNIVPRDSGNQTVARVLHHLAFLSRMFPALIDKMNAAGLEKKYGFLRKHGVMKLPYGPNVQMIKYRKVPVLDIGTMELIRKGVISIFPGIESFQPFGVKFTNGEVKNFDAVILGTGFTPDVTDFFAEYAQVTDASGRPLKSGEESELPGIFFCGFTVSPYGMLNQIGREARKIAKKISSKRRKKNPFT